MHLNKVEAIGFKSFANKVNINFEPGINGIVGPNGCGKSNITDAIKWVLGEQSTKNLRASGMSDVIFAGSDDYKKQNFAQVSLIFDNKDRTLDIEFEQVEITRRLYRSGESEYLINKSPSRLKDIVELIMDTGLGKDSLSIISQGAIADFASAKPEDRRSIFEEAASVSKYKKRKIESLKKLDRTTQNLQRLSDIISELESQIEPLKKQAIKAKKYLNAKDKLEDIEISVIVHEINANEILLKEIKSDILDSNSQIVLIEKQLNESETNKEKLDVEYKKSNNNVAKLQQELLLQIEEIDTLENEKKEVYALNTQNTDDFYIQKLKEKIDSLQTEIEVQRNNYINFSNQKELLMQTFNEIQENYNILITNKNKLTNQINSTNNKFHVLKNSIDNNSNLYAGVKAIITQKDHFSGYIGLVKDLFTVDEKYANAISKAISSQLQNIVMVNSQDVKDAVNFLKRNKAGRATFIPLDLIKNRYVNDDDIFVAKSQNGFIDQAIHLIKFDNEYNKMFSYFLSNILIVDNIDHAIELSKLLKSKYKIVTLDGEVINPGGIVTGGNSRNESNNILTLKQDLEKVTINKSLLENELLQVEDEIFVNQQNQANTRNKINQFNISIAKSEENENNNKYQFKINKAEYELLTKKEYQQNNDTEDITNKLLLAKNNKQEIINNIQTNREESLRLSKLIETIEISLKASRIEINNYRQKYSDLNIKLTKIEIYIKSNLDRLAIEYKLTIDHAREISQNDIDIKLAKEEVSRWKSIIKSLGNVNLLAVDEYEKIKERFDFMSTQKNDLESSRSEILQMINETDKIMVKKFKETIEEINDVLPDTFKKLFGGGNATLAYTDPSNILETGIEIQAQPPGKTVQNLNLFSGGEKAMIALSVLFAILKVRPVPLCILDEVEAALDQANVERFAKFLKEFAYKTQFIVITHRPGTMEQCDVLYGVTMQEKGVTKMIGVKLEEAKDMIDKE
ncbi:chromosome segregation protein SMC [Mycoplasma sp. P36-A1]|uniref:chromosome segregation protein SMC n=1 Tax=Mycoplasma sp. P36-A1 TaxID=3252900 RepID=UPI003C2DA418